jgi:hypothetical protein
VRLTTSFPKQFQPLTMSTDRRGRIVLVGTVGGYVYFGATPSQLGIVRLLPDGTRDLPVGPSLLQRGRGALVGATFTHDRGQAGLALVKLRRR